MTVSSGTWWRRSRVTVASAVTASALVVCAHAFTAAAAVVSAGTQPSLTSPFICTSAEFLTLPSVPLGSSPVMIKSLIKGEQVCLEFTLALSVASGAEWFAVGLSRSSEMVSSPPASVMLFHTVLGTLEAYVLSGRSTSAVTRSSDQSSFVVASASLTAKSFSYQRTLAAATASDVAVDVTQDAHFIWAYGASWPIGGHRSGTRGTATYRFASTAAASDAHANNTLSTSAPPGNDSIRGDATFDPTDRGNNRDDTVLRARTPFCDSERNCPAIIGGAAFVLLLVGGLLTTRLLARTSLARMLLFHSLAAPPVKTTTNRSIAHPCTMLHQALADLRIGELFVVLTFVGAVVALVALNIDAHTTAAATAGQVVLLTLMFVMLPVSRVPLWSIFFSSSFERIVKFHRWIGMALTVAVIVHLVLALKLTSVTQSEKYGEVVPLYGFIAFVAFVTMALLANEVVRRVAFEVFYISHRVLSVVGLVFAVLHTPKIIGVALAMPLALYALAVVMQWTLLHTSRVQANIAAVRVHGSVAAATLVLRPTKQTERLAAQVRPGAFFWLKAPSVSRTQWHPFSAIVTPDGKSVGFCVQAASSERSFTRALAFEALKKRVVPVSLCGPFGTLAIDVAVYDIVVLVAGGVGITPIVSLVNQQRLHRAARTRPQHWYGVWSVKSAEQLLLVDEFLPSQSETTVSPPPAGTSLQAENSSSPTVGAAGAAGTAAVSPPSADTAALTLTWSFHVSTVKNNSSITRQTGERLQFKAGRPVLRQIISTERFKARGRVAVLACGPPTLMVETQALARECGFDFHKELFHW